MWQQGEGNLSVSVYVYILAYIHTINVNLKSIHKNFDEIILWTLSTLFYFSVLYIPYILDFQYYILKFIKSYKHTLVQINLSDISYF